MIEDWAPLKLKQLPGLAGKLLVARNHYDVFPAGLQGVKYGADLRIQESQNRIQICTVKDAKGPTTAIAKKEPIADRQSEAAPTSRTSP